MDWTGIEIRTLRKRLGWTMGDFSRRLGVSKELVNLWEKDVTKPDREVQFHLINLFNLAQAAAERTKIIPESEHLMGQMGYSQVNCNQMDALKRI